MAISKQQIDDNSLTIFKKISEMLNREIESHGKLQKNNKAIWKILHEMDNDIWSMYCHGIKILEQEFPQHVDMSTLKSIIECEQIINKYGHLSTSGNILTPYKTRTNGHNYKGKAWRLINQGRETWNRAMGIDLPNDDSSKLTPKTELFDVDWMSK
tara:strand:- start:57 stop:524 length:468 start_codon:yes stop_codon:yes gene_type:complete